MGVPQTIMIVLLTLLVASSWQYTRTKEKPQHLLIDVFSVSLVYGGFVSLLWWGGFWD